MFKMPFINSIQFNIKQYHPHDNIKRKLIKLLTDKHKINPSASVTLM